MQFSDLIEKKDYKIFELILLFIAAPSFIIFDLIDLQFRWVIFIITGIYIIVVLIKQKPGKTRLWLDTINSRKVILLALFYLVFVLVVMFYFGYSSGMESGKIMMYGALIAGYGLISVPIQEFFFRSFFFYRYEESFGIIATSVLNVLLFSFYHKIYGGWLGLFLSFAAGIILTYFFITYRNLFYNWIAHAIMGLIIFLLGLGVHFTDLL